MKPDIASFLGVIIALASIIVGQHLEGGHLSSILQITAALIVLGGTLGATMLQFPLPVTIGAFKKLASVFMSHDPDLPAIIKKLVEFANVSRKEGLLALQGRLEEIPDPFMKRGLQLIIDGTEEHAVRDILELEISTQEANEEPYEKWYEAVGGYAPTVGILGAVLGLIHVMENLDKPESLGGGIAVAFVATIYGVGAANLFALPFSNKIKNKAKAHGKSMELTLEGILSIQRGVNPNQIQEHLSSYLSEDEKKKLAG